MALALAQAARLKPELRLADALSRFEASLPGEQKIRLNAIRTEAQRSPPSPQDVMQLTAQIDRGLFYGAGRGHCLGPRLTNFLQAIQQFASLGDVVVGGSQNVIACGVWALARLTLLSLVNFSSYFERLSTILMTIGRSAPRYETLALLYPQSINLQSCLSEYYILVVRLCHHAFIFTQKSVLAQVASAMNDSELKSCQSELMTWANTIKEEINLLVARRIETQASEATSYRALKISRWKTASIIKRNENHSRVLRLCSTYDHEVAWKQFRKLGYATIFKQSEEYLKWRDHSASCTLIYTGKLGAGKSVLLANIIDDLNLQEQNKRYTVAYFFCQYNVPESLLARTVIGSLARQLLKQIKTFAFEDVFENNTLADIYQINAVLQKVIPSGFSAYFILDGLDDCDPTERDQLIYQLGKLQSSFSLNICTSLRLGVEKDTLKVSCSLLDIRNTSIPDSNADIEAYINARLESCVESERLSVGDPSLVEEIRKTLLDMHQGMFLWVFLQIETLCSLRTDASIREGLASLPRDLPATYSRILGKINTAGHNYQERILKLLLAAHHPLTTQELREALSVIPGDNIWNAAHLINDIYSTLGYCGSLVTVDEDTHTVYFVHHSVQQFLLKTDDQIDVGHFTYQEANIHMANTIVTYLSYAMFSKQLVTSNDLLQIPAGYIPTSIVRSTITNSSGIPKLAQRILKAGAKIKMESNTALALDLTPSASKEMDEFEFFAYAKSHWLQHAFYLQDEALSDLEKQIRRLLSGLLRSGTVDLEVKDRHGRTPLWQAAARKSYMVFRLLIETEVVDANTGLQRYESPLSLATSTKWNSDPVALVRLLLEKGASPESRLLDKSSVLHWAVKARHPTIVKMLLEKGADPNLKDSSFDETPLHWFMKLKSADEDSQAILKLLLNNGADYNLRNLLGHSPVRLAISQEAETSLELMLSNQASLDSRIEHGQTPLHIAVHYKAAGIVKMLLIRGAQVGLKDPSGLMPLHVAAYLGSENIAKMLLQHGAYVDTRIIPDDQLRKDPHFTLKVPEGRTIFGTTLLEVTRKGRTPLHMAIVGGYRSMIELLLAVGANIESQDCCYETPLHLAVEFSDITHIQLLKEKGANMESRNIWHQTPLWKAIRLRNRAAAIYLVKAGASYKDANMYHPGDDSASKIAIAGVWNDVLEFVLKTDVQLPAKPSAPAFISRSST